MKHLFLLTLSFSLFFFSCNDSDDLVTKEVEKTETSKRSRLKWGEKVKLIHAKRDISVCASRSCQSSTHYLKMTVEVANLGGNKVVSAHQQMANGSWKDFNLTYKLTTSIGTEIWELDYSEWNGSPEYKSIFGNQFVIKYVVNGQTYWDNNNNQNYKFTSIVSSINESFEYIKNFQSWLKPSNSGSTNFVLFDVAAQVKNIAYHKEVNVVYTFDNWKTSKVEKLSYYTSPFSNPPIGYETWTKSNISIPVISANSAPQVKYALVYKVNGVEYWDNNFGKNYVATYN